MPKAPASTRATDHVTLSIEGELISIPVSVFTGTVSEHGVKRKTFLEVEGEPDHPIGRGVTDKTSGALLDPADAARVVGKIETEYGFVHVSETEQETLFSVKPKTIVIKAFQPLSLFHRGEYVPKSLYFIEPTQVKVGKTKAADQAATSILSVILESMRDEGACAVVEFTTRGIPKPGILLPDGSLWLVWHTDALREQREWERIEVPEPALVKGRQILKDHWSEEPIDLTDTRSELILNFANEKAAKGDFSVSAEEAVAAPAASAGGFDLMAALGASVEAAKADNEKEAV